MESRSVGIVGVGLIGGSIALAALARRLSRALVRFRGIRGIGRIEVSRRIEIRLFKRALAEAEKVLADKDAKNLQALLDEAKENRDRLSA
jgi:prephenate dehydrogenase